MAENPPLSDDIPTQIITHRCVYLKPANTSSIPVLPGGTTVVESFEDFWQPLPDDPNRQIFRIRVRDVVFVAGAEYTFKPNTTLLIKCQKAILLPNPAQSDQSTVVINLPGADANQEPPAKAAKASNGDTASFKSTRIIKVRDSWRETEYFSATRGHNGTSGVVGGQGGDAGTLIFEADEIDFTQLTDEKSFFVAKCVGGKGTPGGAGGDGGDGGNGIDDAGQAAIDLGNSLESRLAYHEPKPLIPSDMDYLRLIEACFLGAEGGKAGNSGIGGYGGSGGELEIKLPANLLLDDKVKTRFCVHSSIGEGGNIGIPGVPGDGGHRAESFLCKLHADRAPYLKEDVLRWWVKMFNTSQQVDIWVKWLEHEIEPKPSNGSLADPVSDNEARDRRMGAGHHEPTTKPNIIFRQM